MIPRSHASYSLIRGSWRLHRTELPLVRANCHVTGCRGETNLGRGTAVGKALGQGHLHSELAEDTQHQGTGGRPAARIPVVMESSD